MNRVFFTSDTHFGHTNIIKLCNRPFSSVEEMNESLIANWNRVVAPRDTVYHLGDFAWTAAAGREALSRLNGTIHLIEGNHDLSSLNKEFASVSSYREVEVEGQKIVLFHYPIREWNGAFRGAWHLYGHVHNLLNDFGKSCDIGVDAWGFGAEQYAPISFEKLKLYMDGRPLKTEGSGFNTYVKNHSTQEEV